eukprot:6346153-Prymnesium_polylepis.4
MASRLRHKSTASVAQGSEHRLSDSKVVNPTAMVRVPTAYTAGVCPLATAESWRAPCVSLPRIQESRN